MSPNPNRLAELRIKEVSGVDYPANKSDGWMVLKAAQAGVAALVTRLEARAAELGIRLREGEAQRLAEEATARGIDITDEDIDKLVRLLAEPEESGGSQAPPLAAASVEEMAERTIEALNPGDPRNKYAVKTVALQAKQLAHLERLSNAEAVAKVVKRLILPGSPASRATETLAKELSAGGMNADQAKLQAARDMLALKSAQRREQSIVAKGKGDDVAAVAGIIRSARVAKSMTQQDVAKALRISVRQVQNYEGGEAVPDVNNAYALAKVLDLPLEARNELGRLLREARSRAAR